jgi:hypothetical protein
MTFELVLDNSKMLANCFEEGPITIDLGAWNATDPGGAGAYDEMGTPDTSSFVTIPNLNRYAPEYFAETDQGVPASNVNIFMPATPAGYVLTEAKYVVIARRSANDGAAAAGYDGAYPVPTTVPFLYCESSGVTNWSGNSVAPSEFVFNDIPVGSFGEVVCSAPEVLSRLTGAPGAQNPANRIWVEDFIPGTGQGSATIDVAYFAIRLYYNPA